MRNLNAKTLYSFTTGDFRALWDSVAANQVVGSRGNFTFSLLAMLLLELASRAADGRPGVLANLAHELEQRDPRYFTRLPFSAPPRKSFTLPAGAGSPREHQLLFVLFDLIRNGQAHQAQQIVVDLGGGATFFVALSGPSSGQTLSSLSAHRGTSKHLSAYCGRLHTGITLSPGLLFLDLEAAIDAARVFDGSRRFPYFTRPSPMGGVSPKHYIATPSAIRNALRQAGH